MIEESVTDEIILFTIAATDNSSTATPCSNTNQQNPFCRPGATYRGANAQHSGARSQR
jgi:hypothetical protein